MKRKKILLIILTIIITVSLLGASLSVSAAEESGCSEADFVPGEVVVGLNSDIDTNTNYEVLFPELDIVQIDTLELEIRTILTIKLREKTSESVIDAIESLENNPNVAYADPNYIAEMTSEPNDPYFNYNSISLWNMRLIRATEAWDIATGNSSVSVGIIDSGVSPVEDLVDNLDMVNGYNFVDPGTDPIDDLDHGTPVAGVIGAVGNNGKGVAGICWDINIVPLKVSARSTGGVPMNLVAEAVEKATEMELPIINISIEYFYDLQALREAIAEYEGLIVVSAGNSAYNIDINKVYPASYTDLYDNIIVVGNSEARGSSFENVIEWPATDSNIGYNSVHLFAPGTSIFTTSYSGAYYDYYGTSFAAPHVTGTAALLLSVHPEYTTAQLKEAILNTVDEVEAFSDICITGGRLNVKEALLYNPQILGDLDDDWILTNMDVIILSRYIDGYVVLSEEQLELADMNSDGNVDSTDLELLVQIIVEQ